MPFDVGGNIWNGAMAKVQNSRSIITRGLVLHLDAGVPGSYPGSGTTWSDLSGNGNNGSFQGDGVSFSSVNGGSIVFAGSDDYVSFSANDDLDIRNKTATFCYWAKSSTTSGEFYIISKQDSSGSVYDGYRFGHYSGAWRMRFSDGSNDAEYTSGAVQNDGTWKYYSFVVGTSNVSVYLDGLLDDGSNDISSVGDINPAQALIIGAGYTGTLQEFTGNIAAVQIYMNKELSAKEVLHNFNAQRDRFGV